MKLRLLVAVGLVLSLVGCITDSGVMAHEKSRGVVLSYPPAAVWEQTKITFSSIGRILRLDEDGKTIDVAVSSERVVYAVIEPYDHTDSKTIVRISAKDGKRETPALASQVLSQIQEQLLGFRGR